ncbi:hypothetical protein GIB67_022107 [Kingdonia uniflora]|uniref:Uncharacterized protein n=1 Tax=Kingdonia uniflora TaxID=39325 RepID=A0A7J7LXX0_9MAGN|nr:hypothetical protein GIB67_022107 [Kingdonia uniflora]
MGILQILLQVLVGFLCLTNRRAELILEVPTEVSEKQRMPDLLAVVWVEGSCKAVGIERNSRSRLRSSNSSAYSRIPLEDFICEHATPSTDNSEFVEQFMQQLEAAALGSSNHFRRRQSYRFSGMSPSQFLNFAFSSNGSDVQETSTTGSVESQGSVSLSSPEGNSPATVLSSERCPNRSLRGRLANGGRECWRVQRLPTVDEEDVSSKCREPPLGFLDLDRETRVRSSFGCSYLWLALERWLLSHASQSTPCSPRRSRPSELIYFSESLKSKFSAVSSRCKESISKGTRGLKEKLLARNNSVKDLRKHVKREGTAGIADVGRMMERLDTTSIHTTEGFGTVSTGVGGSSYVSHNSKKSAQAKLIIHSPNRFSGDTEYGTSSNSQIQVQVLRSFLPGGMEIPHV